MSPMSCQHSELLFSYLGQFHFSRFDYWRSSLRRSFGVGPLIWAPLSEVYGRRVAVFCPYFIGACFTFATASSKDLSAIFITRFFAGFFGSAPVTNTGGVLGDIYSPAERATALAGYSMAVVGGPLLSPVVAGAIITSGVSWRWTEYVRNPEVHISEGLLTDFFIDDGHHDGRHPHS